MAMLKVSTSWPRLAGVFASVPGELGANLSVVMQQLQTALANIAGAINNNISDSGVTGARPTKGLVVGQRFYDTTLVKPVWWDGAAWRDATGAAA